MSIEWKIKKMKLCHGTGIPTRLGDKTLIHNPIDSPNRLNNWDTWGGNVRQKGVKRIWLKCDTCGRKMRASVRVCQDGCCVYFELPAHKPRYWWKRKHKR